MSSTFAAVCLGLIALGVWVGLGVLIYTLLQVRRAAIAVEMVAYDLGESLSRMKTASSKLFDFATYVRSGWMRALETAVGAAMTFWPKRGQTAEGAQAQPINGR